MGQTGEALLRIVAQVAEIDGVVGEIALETHEQAIGLDQINMAVNQTDQVTQQNPPWSRTRQPRPKPWVGRRVS